MNNPLSKILTRFCKEQVELLPENVAADNKIQVADLLANRNRRGTHTYSPGDYVYNHEPLREILGEMRGIISDHPVVLAGGCVRDLYLRQNEDMIRDYDVFVLGCNETEMNAGLRKVIGTLVGAPIPHYEGVPNEPSVHGVYNTTYPFIRCTDRIMHTDKNSKQLQIIWTDAETVEDLFENFDWNVCKFAFDGNTIWDEGKFDSWKNTLTLNHVANPIRTLRRGFRFEEKLHLKFPVETLETLASLILLQAGANTH